MMRIEYKYDEKILKIKELPNGDDIDFYLTFFETDLKKRIEKIQEYFSENSIVTDILVYKHPNNQFQIIVRKDFYVEFILQLFRQQLLQELRWR
jgi:hypothetical protein